MSQQSSKNASLREHITRALPEREIFLRSGGQVRFVRITTKVQLVTLGTLLSVLLLWAGATLLMLVGQVAVAEERAELDSRQRALATSASQVNAYRRSVGDVASDLEERQDFIEELYKSHFGDQPLGNQVVGEPDNAASASTQATEPSAPAGKKISAAFPEAAPLMRLEQRQLAFARAFSRAVADRTAKAEAAIRSFGLNPDALARNNRSAQGGPFVPWKGDRDELLPELADLSAALTRLDRLERSLVAIPSGKPTAAPMMTSSYGYRRDPFNGHAAFHAGLDFVGTYGQPILAAAKGRVSYVGTRQGYGNVVELDHGAGMMTRYAHLAGFNAKVGQIVPRGSQIGRMGSTGRSTGTHLHFEVRVNDAPINPRRFLEARQDVLEIQQDAKQRFADVGNRG